MTTKKKGVIARIHWNKFEKRWTRKTSKGCPRFEYILVDGEWEVEIKPHLKTNPKGFVKTNSEYITYLSKEEVEALLQEVKEKEKLWYDKKEMAFSHEKGDCILFEPNGAFILKR